MNCEHCATPIGDDKAQCPKCKHWNTGIIKVPTLPSQWLSDVEGYEVERLTSGPWDQCFGGGIVPGSVSIIGGEEGSGKSTLLLQIADGVAHKKKEIYVLYVATEELDEQVKDRGSRLKLKNMNAIRIVNAIDGEGIDLESVVNEFSPTLIILDSLPGFYSDIQPDRALTLVKWFKQTGVPTLMSNHLNKDDEHGGYRSILYAVDVVMMLRPADDTDSALRKLYCPTKNRHGKTPAETYFSMSERGLVWVEVDK